MATLGCEVSGSYPAVCGRPEGDHLSEDPHEAADRGDPRRQQRPHLPGVGGVRSGDRFHGFAQLGAGDHCLDALPQPLQRDLLAVFGDFKQHLHRRGQLRRSPRQPWMPGGACSCLSLVRLAQQLGRHQQVPQLQRVVERMLPAAVSTSDEPPF
jgi:hypothetical protein